MPWTSNWDYQLLHSDSLFKITYSNSENPKRMDIEFILFLNRMFSETETKYWPIEFEMAGLIWVIRKTRHMIDIAKQTTVIFTDHATNISISKQTIWANNNINNFNFRLVRTFIYFSQFRMNVKYRPGKKHVISDTLSRLSSGNGPVTLSRNNDFLNLDIYFCDIFWRLCVPKIVDFYIRRFSKINRWRLYWGNHME